MEHIVCPRMFTYFYLLQLFATIPMYIYELTSNFQLAYIRIIPIAQLLTRVFVQVFVDNVFFFSHR